MTTLLRLLVAALALVAFAEVAWIVYKRGGDKDNW